MIQHSKPLINEDDIRTVLKVLKSGDIAVGPQIAELENEISKYVGKRYGVAVSNGTTAIYLALLSLKISKGDQVVLPASVCPGVNSTLN